MMRTAKVFFQIVSLLAVAALMANAASPARAENPRPENQGASLAWLSSTVKVPSRITAAPDDKVLAPLKGNVYGMTSAQFDRGMVDESLAMDHIILLLQRSSEQEEMLTAVIDELKNRRSPLYRHWLNPAQFGNHFGPSDADISVVSTWLQNHGFKIDQVTPGKTAIVFSGTAGQVHAAFHTEIHNLNVNGEKHIANLTEPMIPAALAPVVGGFRSLNDFYPKPLLKNAGTFHREKSSGKVQRAASSHPLPQFTETTDGYYIVGPQDFYTIYNENPLFTSGVTGAGVNIAVVEETDVNPADVNTFRSAFALPPYPSSPNGTQGGVNYLFGADGVFCTDPGILTDGEEAEADIDLQWAGTAAPNSVIDFVSCASTSTSAGIDLSAMYIVNELAPGVAASPVSTFSESYGACELLAGSAAATFYTDMWEQAAAQGQTVVVSSGDSGSMGCPGTVDAFGDIYSTDNLSVNVLASTIYNIAAGGTDFSDVYQTYSFNTGTCCATWWNQTQSTGANGYESALSYVPEVTWGGYCSNRLYTSFAQANGYGIGATPLEVCNFFYNNEPGSGYIDLVGGGGGISQFNNIPTWQAVYGVGLKHSSTAFRNLPDISMFAASGFWLHLLPFCESDLTACDFSGSLGGGSFSGAGGTSFVAPEMAGVMALVVQQTTANQGPANYNLYGLAAQEYGVPGGTFNGASCSGSGLGAGVGAACLFQDIAGDTPCLPGGTTVCNTGGTTITTTIVQPCLWNATYTNCYHHTAAQTIGISSVTDTSNERAYAVGEGYDVATGLGSLNINNLVTQWGSLSTLWSTDTTLSAAPTTIGGAETTTLTSMVATTARGGFVAPVGSVTYYLGSVGGTSLGTGLLSSTCTGTPPNYSCSPGTSTLTVGTGVFQLGPNNVFASFPGDGANDAASSSNPAVVITVSQLATTTTVTSDINPSVYGQAVTFTATIAPISTPAPTGTVEFQANGVDISGCSAVAVAAGTAQCVSGGATLTNGLPVGTNAVTAIYSGDTNYTGSTSLPLSQVVTPAVLTVTGDPASMMYGGAIPAFTATITGFVNGDTSAVVSGTPSLIVSCSVGMIRRAVTPQPTCLFPPGTFPIVAAQGSLAAANYTFTFANGTLTVTQAATTNTLTSSPNPSVLGQAVTFNVSVAPATAGSNGVSPTGAVEFQANGADISGCSAVTASYGVAACTTTALPLGASSITAIYPGDTNYTGSTSATLAQTVNNAVIVTPGTVALSTTEPTLNAKAGDTVTAPVSVAVTGPIATVNLTCSVAPSGPACTVSPATATTFPATATVSIATTSSDATLRRSGGAWMFALMLPGLLLIPAGSRTARRRMMWLLGGLLLLLTLSVAGCGGASTSALYQVTVTGTDPVSGATGSTFIVVQLHK